MEELDTPADLRCPNQSKINYDTARSSDRPVHGSRLSDARAHAISTRLGTLADLDAAETLAWKWQLLTEASELGLRVAARINAASRVNDAVTRVDTSALNATHTVARGKETRRSRTCRIAGASPKSRRSDHRRSHRARQ